MHPGPNGRLVSLALPVIVEHAEPDSISVVSEVNGVVTGVIRPSFSQLGVILAQDGCPHDPDGTWPCRPVREVIEKAVSKDLETGLGTGVMNSVGAATIRDPSAGGAAERALAERYEGYAAAVRASHPCTAGVLRRIGRWYREKASREDHQSEMWELS